MTTTSPAVAADRPTTVPPPAFWQRMGGKALPALAALTVFLVVWEVAVRLADLPTYLLPKPSDIFDAIVVNRQELAGATFRTALASLSGLGLAIVLGVAVAIVLGMSNVLERTFFPYAIVLQIIPIVTIAPLLVIWIGPGLSRSSRCPSSSASSRSSPTPSPGYTRLRNEGVDAVVLTGT